MHGTTNIRKKLNYIARVYWMYAI